MKKSHFSVVVSPQKDIDIEVYLAEQEHAGNVLVSLSVDASNHYLMVFRSEKPEKK